MDLNSPDSMDTGTTEDTPLIPHIPGQLNNDLYAVLVKHNKDDSKPTTPSEDKKDEDTSVQEILPPGWERHEGIYSRSNYIHFMSVSPPAF